ncbi:MAG: PAS domain S-box protein [Chlorobaculum sp.]|nr:PAS domain S-box protein [Chlorobaculum sp.]
MPTSNYISSEAADNDQPTLFSLLESLPDPAIIIMPDGRILAINTRFASMFGTTSQSWLDHAADELFGADLRFAPLAGFLQKELAVELSFAKRISFEVGREAWKATLSPIRSASGAVMSLLVSLQDISEYAEAEKKLRVEGESGNTLMDGEPYLLSNGMESGESGRFHECLRACQEKLFVALHGTLGAIWEWDIKTDRFFWSDQIWKLYGLEPQGDISSHILCGTNVHPEDRDLTFQTIISASKRQTDFSIEYRVCHSDGSVHWLMCLGVPLQASGKEPGSYFGMIMDITERRRTEQERRKSQNQLNLVIEQGDIGLWTVDLRDSSARRSLHYARIFGYDSVDGDWSLEAFVDHVVPEERETIRETITQYCKKHLSHTFECRIHTADNRLRWILVFGTFNYDTSTRTYYLSGIVQDISVRKQAEQLLRESEQKFRNIFEFSSVAIGISDDRAGTLLDVNASWLRLFGYLRDEVIGKKLGELGIYLDTEDHGNIMRALREHGRVSNRQLELKNREGKTITVLFSAESITIAGQGNVLLMMSDITVLELQQASINQLERAVAERTEQLQNEVVRLNRFLSMISHEHRTPLAIISGNLDLIRLKHKNGNCNYERETNKIKQAIDRLVKVMEISIQESRHQESSEELVVTDFQLEPAILSQVEAFRSMWPERTIHYASCHLEGGEILGAPGQFGMAIFNLLDNARKYSPPESPIDLVARVENGEAIITIRNDGKSISSAESGELFEKYRRGSNAANTGGAGIGLWLVKDIVERHHGSVTLHGTDSGVEAVIILPLAGSEV